jgi:membrane fusion protein (multidrug efflux system)
MAEDAPAPSPKRRWLPAMGLALVAVIAGAAWFFLGARTPAPSAAMAPPAPAVGVRPVVKQGVSESFEFVGHIKAVDKVELRARIEGFLEKVLFIEGQTVKAGDLLYQIEKVQYEALVEQAKANLAAAEAESVNAKLQYTRQLDLSKKQFSPQSVVDQDRAAVDTSAAKIMQAKAALRQAEVNLGYTDIRAPISGRIGRTAYTMGNLVNPASGVLATIVSQDPIYVLFPISVRDLETIREARRKEGGGLNKIEILIRLTNGQLYSHPGTWNFTDPQVDELTDTLIMRATIPNPDGVLADGQVITAIIRERKEEPRLVVPQTALQVDQSGFYVLVVNAEHKVETRRIKTGPNIGTDVVALSGVQEGDKVIVDGIQKVRPGQVVQETVLLPPKNG